MKNAYSVNEIADLLSKTGSGNLMLGDRQVRRTVKYINFNASAKSGTFQLIQQSTVKGVAITNFDGNNKLNSDKSLIVLGCRLKVDVTTADPTAAVYLGVPTAALKNAEVRFIQDDVLFDAPVTALFNTGVPTNNDDDFFRNAPFYVKPGKEYKVEVETATAIAATTCIRLEFDVLEFVKK